MRDYQHDIERYLRGDMTPEEMHALEREALRDPFLADALEGASSLQPHEFTADVSALNNKILKKKKNSGWGNWPLRIAASLLMIAAATALVWQVVQPETNETLSYQKETTPSAEGNPGLAKDAEGESDTVEAQQPVEQPLSSGTSAAQTEPVKAGVSKRSATWPAQAGGGEKGFFAEQKGETLADSFNVALAEKSQPVAVTSDAKPLEEAKQQPSVIARELELQQSKAKEETLRSALRDDTAERKKSAPAGAPPSRVIRGRITSAEDGQPLPGVNVVVRGTTSGTVTDADGTYEIEVPQSGDALIYSFIGLQSQEVFLGERKEIDVAMTTDVSQLSEVVVVGYSGTDKDDRNRIPTYDFAYPEGGYRAFRNYLEENIQYPQEALEKKVEGRVTVEFFVESNGTLSDFQIIRSVGYGCDEELIRLIKSGPKWEPTKKDDMAVRDRVRVRLKFNLPK
jgi:TonB family protein